MGSKQSKAASTTNTETKPSPPSPEEQKPQSKREAQGLTSNNELLPEPNRTESKSTDEVCQQKPGKADNTSLLSIDQLKDKPWRAEVEWTFEYYERLIKDIKIKPSEILSSLLVGQKEAGKSSFINSIRSIDKSKPTSSLETKTNDKYYCVLFVLDSLSVFNDDISKMGKIKELHTEIKNREIPSVVILTKIDELSTEVKKDFRNTFKSTKVKEAVKKTSEFFEITLANVHPVWNIAESENDKIKCIPLLLPIRQMVQFATSKLESDDY